MQGVANEAAKMMLLLIQRDVRNYSATIRNNRREPHEPKETKVQQLAEDKESVGSTFKCKSFHDHYDARS